MRLREHHAVADTLPVGGLFHDHEVEAQGLASAFMPPDAECKESGVSQLFFSLLFSIFLSFCYFWLVGWFNFCSLGVTEREAFINYNYSYTSPFPIFFLF